MFISHTDLIAIVAVVDVATHGQEGPVAGDAVGPRYNLPHRYFEPVLRALTKSGILTGKRGMLGGYQLARSPHFITVDDILRGVRAMQGGAVRRSIASSIKKRIALPALDEAEMAFSRALQSMTIAALVNRTATGSARKGPEGTAVTVNIAQLPELLGASPRE
jgi:Rrf2 family iron-sulfur cluster assembly transcriptional regulator